MQIHKAFLHKNVVFLSKDNRIRFDDLCILFLRKVNNLKIWLSTNNWQLSKDGQ